MSYADVYEALWKEGFEVVGGLKTEQLNDGTVLSKGEVVSGEERLLYGNKIAKAVQGIDVTLGIGEGKAPLTELSVSGMTRELIPAARLVHSRDVLIEVTPDAPRFLQGRKLLVGLRHSGGSWEGFLSGQNVPVNVTLVGQGNQWWAIGSLKRKRN